jgi:hypothetical protein
MAVAEQESTNGGGGGAASAALKAAAAAAATGAATYAVRRVRSHDSGKSGDEERESSQSGKNAGSQSILASAAATSWEAASDALIPMAEEAAEAAGKYLATHGPEILRERIVPRFIEAFNDAK